MTRLPPRADVALAVGLGLLSMQSAFEAGELRSPAWAVIGLIQLSVLPLAYRRVWPVAVFGASVAATVAGYLAVGGFQILGPIFALYAVARHCERSTSLGAVAVAVTASLIPAAAVDDSSVLFTVAVAIGFGAAWLLGRYGGRREAELAAARAQAVLAVELERARIARELHDIISHNVSVMVVQAAAGRDVFATSPERSLDALGAIESAGREALAELRMLLEVVHEPGQRRAPLTPQPCLERLPALVDQVRAAGVTVDLDASEIEGLPEAVDVSAYRIVQEALTNVLKHAKATTAAVALRRTPTELRLDITDDGVTAPSRATGGRGLIGMRERVHLLGGDLAAGPRPGGGFAVRATIPLTGAGR